MHAYVSALVVATYASLNCCFPVCLGFDRSVDCILLLCTSDKEYLEKYLNLDKLMCRDGFHDIYCVFYFMFHLHLLHVVGLYGCQLYFGKDILGPPRKKKKKVNNLTIRIVMIFVIIW